MDDLTNKVTSYIEDHRDDLVELLRTMVRTRSVNPAFDAESQGEQAMADLVVSRYTALASRPRPSRLRPGGPM